jgi:hypothetical protein
MVQQLAMNAHDDRQRAGHEASNLFKETALCAIS